LVGRKDDDMPLTLLSTALATALHPVTTPYRSPGVVGAELTTADGRSLPLVGARLRGEARGGLARVELEQRFVNRHEETLRVTYRMPLPADGAVSAYAFEIDGRTIRGRVHPKAAARERFERALVEGHTAALLEQNTSDIFTQEIGNLPAGASLTARITVDVRLAWLPEGEWELRFPTVIGPRYVAPGEAREVVDATHVEPALEGIAARVDIEVHVGDVLTGAASSPSHALARNADGAYTLRSPAALDRDIVLRWPVAARSVGASLALGCRPEGDAYGLLTLVPPSPGAGAAAVARDLIVLIDTSGSMGGPPLAKAKQAVALLIDSLDERDRLELIEFSMRPTRFRKEPFIATPQAKREAIAWVRALEANGGTNMAEALDDALTSLRPSAQRQVVLVTDGYVGGEQRLVRRMHEAMPRGCRLHFVGVGAAVNRSLACAMARAGRGAEVLLDLDEDVERPTRRLVDRLRAPVLTNVEVLGSALVRHAPEHLPDVFAGAPLLAALQLKPEGGELVIRGDLADDVWVERVKVPSQRPGEGSGAIAALYAREHVADLETRWTLGDEAAIDREIEATAVEHQIATRLTSWVAVDEASHVEGPGRSEVVPQELPYGTRAESFGLRAAALSYPIAGPMAAVDLAMPMAPSSSMPMPMQAERQRRPGAGPDLELAHLRPRKHRSSTPLALLLLFLMLAVAALAWWLLR
jgi:Ca-activated chloride channel family protein